MLTLYSRRIIVYKEEEGLAVPDNKKLQKILVSLLATTKGWSSSVMPYWILSSPIDYIENFLI